MKGSAIWDDMGEERTEFTTLRYHDNPTETALDDLRSLSLTPSPSLGYCIVAGTGDETIGLVCSNGVLTRYRKTMEDKGRQGEKGWRGKEREEV
jgi:hypothetical protein